MPDWKTKRWIARRTAEGSRPITAGGCGLISMAVMSRPSQWNCDESGVCAPTRPGRTDRPAAAMTCSLAVTRIFLRSMVGLAGSRRDESNISDEAVSSQTAGMQAPGWARRRARFPHSSDGGDDGAPCTLNATQ